MQTGSLQPSLLRIQRNLSQANRKLHFSSGSMQSARAVIAAAVPPGPELQAAVEAHVSLLAEVANATSAASSSNGDGLLSPITEGLEATLKVIRTQLDRLHVPYSYGWSIVTLTLLIKIVTFPLTKQQVESTLAVQSLKPKIDQLKARYGEDKDRVSKETSALYEQAGVNPLAGCLPTLATLPIFIGLYRSLTNVANEGLLDAQGFFWIPNLAGPTTMTLRQAGAGTAWLYPLVDGHPPIGWHDAIAYCVLPMLLVLAQYISSSVIMPPVTDPDADSAKMTKALTSFLPLMIGWFSLNVPSGLGLYYFSNTVLTSLIQVWLRKLGGAQVRVRDLGPVTKVGSGRRMGEVASDKALWEPPAALLAAGPGAAAGGAAGSEAAGGGSAAGEAAGARWAKRKRREAPLVAPAASSTA